MNNRKIKINFWGAVGQVTGSNFLLEAEGLKILIDCGLFQESEPAEGKNQEPFPYNPSDIDFLFITHGHLDHIGRVPQLIAQGFRGKIFSTPETKEISKLILEDALKVQNYNNKNGEKGRSLYPHTKDFGVGVYSEPDLHKTFKLWETLSYGKPFKAGESFEAVFRNSGHILGSAMVEFKFPGSDGSLLFTGDLGNWPNPLLQKAEVLTGVEYLIIESVYGDRNHKSFEEGNRIFKEAIKKVIEKGGTLLIPSFSLERAQVILYELNKLVENKIIPAIPVFFDSPLAIKLLKIYKKSGHLFNQEARALIKKGDDIFSFPNLVISREAFESKSIKEIPSPKIIIAGSGMSQGGRIIFHEAEYLPDKKNGVLLIGYQAVGTLGHALKEGVKEVDIKGRKIKVRARVEHLDSFSGHKDLDGLLDFVYNLGNSLKKVFVVMGEPKSSLFLAQRIRDYLGVQAIVPEKGEDYYI